MLESMPSTAPSDDRLEQFNADPDAYFAAALNRAEQQLRQRDEVARHNRRARFDRRLDVDVFTATAAIMLACLLLGLFNASLPVRVFAGVIAANCLVLLVCGTRALGRSGGPGGPGSPANRGTR